MALAPPEANPATTNDGMLPNTPRKLPTPRNACVSLEARLAPAGARCRQPCSLSTRCTMRSVVSP